MTSQASAVVAGEKSGIASARRPRRSRAMRQPEGFLYVLPPLALFTLVILVPIGYGVWISLWNWDGVSQAKFVGLGNYVSALTDPIVGEAAVHSIILVLFYSAFPICIGLILTGIIARHPLRLMGMWRVFLFLPQVLSIVVVGVAWQWLLQSDGPVNQLLRLVGLGRLTRVWLGDFTWALPSEGAIGTWLMAGLCMVLFLSGAQHIDTELYDAAAIDGAGPIREFFTVTIPGLRRVIVVAGILTFAVSLNNFALIWVTTQGGPGNQTQVASTLIYTRAFVLQELGAASALAVILGIIVLAISAAISRLSSDS